MKNLKRNRLIILNAGDSFELDGFNKLLIRNPKNGLRIIDEYINIFKEYEITVVVGYKAMNIMNLYPKLNFVYNKYWQSTNSSYSLSLALNTQPSIIASCDLIVNKDILKNIEKYKNVIFLNDMENKKKNSLNAKISKSKHVLKIYRGKRNNSNDRELSGIFKITCKEILNKLKKNCTIYPNLHVGENIPLNLKNKLNATYIKKTNVKEINTPLDYINLLND